MAGNVIDESKVDEILDKLGDISGSKVNVGIIGDGERYKGTQATALDIANIHEFGASNGIPERPFIRGTFDNKKNKLVDQSQELIIKAITTDMSADTFLEIFGTYGEDLTRDYLRELDTPPLKAETIRAKGSSSVLIDTGQLINSISYEVER